jgi:hypothetical protein
MRKSSSLLIQPVGFEYAVEHAANELVKYLTQLAPVTVGALPVLGALPPDSAAHIVLGTATSLAGAGLGALPKANELDDALAIIPSKGKLYLAGSNGRSVLFAAYRLLEELGVVFLRPGPGGEVVPRKASLSLPRRAIREAASYRHRGICIEGSPRMEHTLDVLDWMAKKKMNTFQLQFRHAGVFWRRGYNHSPEMDAFTRSKRLSDEDCIILDDRVIARCKELGMVVHRVGHGWTAATLGYEGVDWNETPSGPVPARMRPWLAQVGGKREFFRNEPTNTELCYSNPEAREAFMQTVMTYARRHPEVDALHVWLSDATNNKCECALCRKQTPTDWYMHIINELGRRLKAEGMKMRLVLLGYFELIWPPEKIMLTADNSIFMYAPMGRCYRHHIADEKCGETQDLSRPPLNAFRRLGGNKTVAALAKMWKRENPPDTFLFDYHMWAPVWSDALGMDLGDVMAQDMKDMKELGLNGMVSCQCIRAFYPHPYMPAAMADIMWNRETPPKRLRRAIMLAAFGRHAAEVESYLADLVKTTRVGQTYRHQTIFNAPAEHRATVSAVAGMAGKALKRFSALAKAEREAVVRTSLELMALHAEQTNRIANAYLAGLKGDKKALAKMRAAYEERLPEVLGKFSPWVDPKLGEPVMNALWAAQQLTRRRGA